MKKEGHPPYQDVLFVDSSTGFEFVCGSTLQPTETKEFEGKKYPVYRVAVSSASHPFYTKSNQFVDSEGRVDKFMKRYKKKEVAPIEESSDKKEEDAPGKKAAAKKAPAKKATAKKTTAKKTDTESKK